MHVLRLSISLAALTLSLWMVDTAVCAAESVPPYISAAVNDANRPEGQKREDAARKPAETIAFAGLKPGDKVLLTISPLQEAIGENIKPLLGTVMRYDDPFGAAAPPEEWEAVRGC